MHPRQLVHHRTDVGQQELIVHVPDSELAERLLTPIREADCVVEDRGDGWLLIVVPDALEIEARAALEFYLATWTTTFHGPA